MLNNLCQTFLEAIVTTSGAFFPIIILIYIFIYKPRKKFYQQIIPILENTLKQIRNYRERTATRLNKLVTLKGDEMAILLNADMSPEQKKFFVEAITSLRNDLSEVDSDIIKKESEIGEYRNYNFFKVIQDLLDRKFFK